MRRPAKSTDRQARGQRAESLAEAYLQRQGLAIIERNYRCKMGEVDLIADHAGTLVFIEVRLRESRDGNDYGGAAGSITPAKQRRIIKAAQHYLALKFPRQPPPCRFDAVLLNQLSEADLEWLRGAFEVG
ncbi:MAG: YraN family protein [Betaproteobacteria bacterium]|nr:YraN family protein [Betaproteobacteria bacterium]